MSWKKDESGNLVIGEDGNPIFNHNGEEKSINAGAMIAKLAETNSESASRKDEIRLLKEKLSSLDGITDLKDFVETANKNAKLVENMGETEKDFEARLQASIQASTEPLRKQLDEITTRATDAETKLANSSVLNSFYNSKWAAENLVNLSMGFQLLQKHLSYKDGNVVVLNNKGEVMYDENGAVCSVDKALPQIVEASEFKNHILKGSNQSGSGAVSGNGYGTPMKTNNLTEQARLESERY